MRIVRLVLTLSVLLIALTLHSVWVVRADEGFEGRPIPLGTSGGNIRDATLRICCGGTLGALVQDSQGIQYVLSCNHILARTNRGFRREAIIQPALVDQEPACLKDSSDAVANLSSYVPISFRRNKPNLVDAAIAQVQSGEVDSSGSILHIGEVSTSTVSPSPGMSVQKAGRTTGVTTGTITAVDATVDVQYALACGSPLSRTARFTGQIIVGNSGFSDAGDSGSLVVDDCSPYPRAVGLLFAGSSSGSVVNPIGDVLSQFDVSLVGVDGFCTSSKGDGDLSISQALPEAFSLELEAVKGIKRRNEKALFGIEGVVGTGVGLSDTVPGKTVIEIYVKKLAHLKGVLPETLENVPVRIVETGEFVAY